MHRYSPFRSLTLGVVALALVHCGMPANTPLAPVAPPDPSPVGLRLSGLAADQGGASVEPVDPLEPAPALGPGEGESFGFEGGDLQGWEVTGQPAVVGEATGLHALRLSLDAVGPAPAVTQRVAMPAESSVLQFETHFETPGAVLTVTAWPDADDTTRFVQLDVVGPAAAADLPSDDRVTLPLPGIPGHGAKEARITLSLRDPATDAGAAMQAGSFIDVGGVALLTAARRDQLARDERARQGRRDQTARDERARQAQRDQAARDERARQAQRDQAARDERARQAQRDQAARDEAARQARRDQDVRDQARRDQAARDAAARR